MCRVKSVEKVETINNENVEAIKEEYPNGTNNCILLFFIFICIQLVTENYISYGIVKGPLEIITDFIQFFDTNMWIFLLLLFDLQDVIDSLIEQTTEKYLMYLFTLSYLIGYLGYSIQLVTCFVIEKSLALNYLAENVGLLLHGFNNFLLVITILILFPIIKPNPVIAHMCSGYIAFTFFKFFSYIMENRESRQIYQKHKIETGKNTILNNNEEEYTEKLIPYPKSVTLYNLFEFMVGTGNFVYSPNSLIKTQRKLKQGAFALLFGAWIHYACAFISFQYVIPELEAAKSCFIDQQYLKLIAGIGKMIIPVNTIWLLFYHFWTMQCFFPMYGWFWGIKNEVYNLDWWNSKNMTIFWTKWNYQMHTLFKKYIFEPLLARGYNKYTASLVVACASGILHEYFISLPFRSSFGLAFMSYVIQIPIAIVTNLTAKKFGTTLGNILVLTILSLGYTISLNILYYNYTT